MDDTAEFTPDDREKLVAYLDGELSEELTQEIEQTLSRSPVARNEVQQLTRTWELLDLLPRNKAPEDFSEKTLSTIQVVEAENPVNRSWWDQNRNRIKGIAYWGIGLIVAASLGFLATNEWVSDDTDALLDELPIVKNVNKYSEIGSVDFLEELGSSGLFDEDLQNPE